MGMVFGIGLPRCGGQTLQAALAELTGKQIIHSPGKSLPQLIGLEDSIGGAVEVFAPVPYLLENFPDCKLILNIRDKNAWLNSCVSVFRASSGWNHPIWFYPLDHFRHYAGEYLDVRERYITSLRPKKRTLVTDITRAAEWDRLAEFLEVPVPDKPFPRVDNVKESIMAPAPTPPSSFDKTF